MAKILQVVGDFGPTLPKVTDEDDGKILKVQNGEWSPQEDDEMSELSTAQIVKIWNQIMNE